MTDKCRRREVRPMFLHNRAVRNLDKQLLFWSYFSFLLLLVSISINNGNQAFAFCPSTTIGIGRHHHSLHELPRYVSTTAMMTMNSSSEYETIKAMKIREIKMELQSNNISTNDVFEKEELIQRLLQMRQKNQIVSQEETTTTKSKKKKKKRRNIQIEDKAVNGDAYLNDDNHENDNNKDNVSNTMKKNYIVDSNKVSRIPMSFFSLSPMNSVQARNRNDVRLRPSPGRFPAITLAFKSSKDKKQRLTLLVDTACSGLVLRPSAVKRCNISLVSNTGATMTAAGGNTGVGGVANIRDPFVLADGSEILPAGLAAVQDIGALPSELDGIIGLSFLNQYRCVDFDFENSELALYHTNHPTDNFNNEMEVVAEGAINTCQIGVYTVQCTLDGRGPINLLLDTGAASTILNWQGIQDLNMDSNHPLIIRNTESIGAMGADNAALALTHRFVLKRRINFVMNDDRNFNNLGFTGMELNEGSNVNIDIGDLPVLDAVKMDNVGGILGSDVLMRCDVLRLDMTSSSKKTAQMWKKKTSPLYN